MFGIPSQVLVDNGPEFHGAALDRGCREYDITLLHRPVARPHYGGHIERLIGTMMGKVLPGTTDASAAARGGHDSEATAVLTLPEFARWLSLEIGQYHHHEHRMLGTTPAMAVSENKFFPTGAIQPIGQRLWPRHAESRKEETSVVSLDHAAVRLAR
jgi:putative transposase